MRMMSSMFMDPMPLLLLNRARSEDDEPAPCCGGDDDAITRDDAMRRGARGRPTRPNVGGEAKREGWGRKKKLTDNPPASKEEEEVG